MEEKRELLFTQIGIIHSPFNDPKGTPIQAAAAKGITGTVEVFLAYSEGLEDLDGFSHIILIYYFHRVKETKLKVKPFMDDQLHGVFATRAPNRPNPIGISTVKLLKIEKNILHVEGLDILDGTPLIDIKPYAPGMDDRDAEGIGWLEKNIERLPKTKDDGRFIR